MPYPKVFLITIILSNYLSNKVMLRLFIKYQLLLNKLHDFVNEHAIDRNRLQRLNNNFLLILW